MLRYDRSYPYTQRDVNAIILSYGNASSDDLTATRIVELETLITGKKGEINDVYNSEHRPCEERWRSFGWRIVSKELLEV
jgi:hypothetical protein